MADKAEKAATAFGPSSAAGAHRLAPLLSQPCAPVNPGDVHAALGGQDRAKPHRPSSD